MLKCSWNILDIIITNHRGGAQKYTVGCCQPENTRKNGIIKALEKLRRILMDECALAGQHQARLEAVLPLRQLKEKLTIIEKLDCCGGLS